MVRSEQRRNRRVAMSPKEVDDFLRAERTCRMATVGAQGEPHTSALWFAWDGRAIWVSSLVSSQRWVNVTRDPRVSVLVDSGFEYLSLRGVELVGRAERVGEVPRIGEPNEQLEEVERLLANKYWCRQTSNHDGRHAWLRILPKRIVSWDFRKLDLKR
jgi:PPOX class probable F420-dependent enzyme